MRRAQLRSHIRAGFTLIELLVVIAIIALLAAIIFPVFATVRENARQSSSISNMRQISTALGQFELDNHKAPDVLFGYVYGMYSMDDAFAAASASGVASQFFPGLYPEYIRDVSAFRDPDNNDNGSTPAKPAPADVNALGANGKLASASKTFYAEDAYDVSPQVTGDRSLGTTYIARYQSSWTNIDDPTAATAAKLNCSNNAASSLCGTGTDDTGVNFYTHQLRWKNPPAETYVTSTTYHVPNAGTVLVLFEGGSVKKMNFAQFTHYGADSAVGVAANGTMSPAVFWKLIPAGR